MPRIARIVGSGYYHHIVQRGNNRQPVFFCDEDRIAYLSLIEKYAVECSCSIHAYCLMTIHVHLLVIPQKEGSLAKLMQKLSLRYTQYVNKRYKRTGRLWECRFHSSIIDQDACLMAVCRYIESNPVRAGMVGDPLKYEWSSVAVNTTGEKTTFVKPVWDNDAMRQEYANYVSCCIEEEELERIRRATYSGKPMGGSQFLGKVSQDLGVFISVRPRGRPSKMGCVPNKKRCKL